MCCSMLLDGASALQNPYLDTLCCEWHKKLMVYAYARAGTPANIIIDVTIITNVINPIIVV